LHFLLINRSEADGAYRINNIRFVHATNQFGRHVARKLRLPVLPGMRVKIRDDRTLEDRRGERSTHSGMQNETGLVLGRVATEAARPASSPMHFGQTGVLLHGLSGRLATDVSRTGTGDTSRNSHNSRPALSRTTSQGIRGQGERCVALGISRSDSPSNTSSSSVRERQTVPRTSLRVSIGARRWIFMTRSRAI